MNRNETQEFGIGNIQRYCCNIIKNPLQLSQSFVWFWRFKVQPCRYIWLVSKSLEICYDSLSYDINHTYFWKYGWRSFLQSADTQKICSKKLLNGRKTILTSEGCLVKNLERILERINQNRKNILSNYLSSVWCKYYDNWTNITYFFLKDIIQSEIYPV